MKGNIDQVVQLLKDLIMIPSFSSQENEVADLLQQFLVSNGILVERIKNNVWSKNENFDPGKPTILLNSHLDTVKPNKGWEKNPFESTTEGDKIFGLGSNDAGASLVCLASVFQHFYPRKDLSYNIIFAATAEEEISGKNGIVHVLQHLPGIEFAIVGEPTNMDMAIAEKGLIVVDGYSQGTSGHAAHSNNDNPIYHALEDIVRIKNLKFPKVSKELGAVKMTVTQINSGQNHNVIPSVCEFVIDIRTNEYYSNEEVFKVLDQNTSSRLVPRSLRLNSSSIDENHPLVVSGRKLGLKTYGSSTLSDQALMNFPSLKIGPGDTARSHQADEFIKISELEKGLEIYSRLLEELL